MAARRRAPRSAVRFRADSRPDALPRRGTRGRHRRQTRWDRFLFWLGVGRRELRKRELLEAQLRELRVATALLRAEVSVLRQELELASALVAARSAEAARLSMLLPMVQQSAYAAGVGRRERVHLDFSPDVKQLGAFATVADPAPPAARLVDLEPDREVADELVLPVQPASVRDEAAPVTSRGARRSA